MQGKTHSFPVHKAAARGDIAWFEQHWSNEFSTEQVDKKQMTPLMHALRNGHLGVTQFLLGKKACIDKCQWPILMVLTDKEDIRKALAKVMRREHRRPGKRIKDQQPKELLSSLILALNLAVYNFYTGNVGKEIDCWDFKDVLWKALLKCPSLTRGTLASIARIIGRTYSAINYSKNAIQLYLQAIELEKSEASPSQPKLLDLHRSLMTLYQRVGGIRLNFPDIAISDYHEACQHALSALSLSNDATEQQTILKISCSR